jgi:hypothetical protein
MATHLTAEQVAASINPAVSPETVHDARRAGRLGTVKIGRQYFYTPEQVDAWLRAATTTTQLLTGRSRDSIARAS